MKDRVFGSREAFEAYAERASQEYRARYGLAPEEVLDDAMLERMLADAGYPQLGTLPDGPRGMMRQVAGRPAGAVPTDAERRRWRRVNASHLIGHAILHGGGRCPGCDDW